MTNQPKSDKQHITKMLEQVEKVFRRGNSNPQSPAEQNKSGGNNPPATPKPQTDKR